MAQTTNESTRGMGNGAPQDRIAEPGLMGRVRDRANQTIEKEKERALDGIGSVTQAVRGSTQRLRDNQRDTMANYVEQVADQIDRLAARMREKEVAEFLEDVQRFARRQPAVFIGSAFALGLIGARFLKSSPDPRRPDLPVRQMRGTSNA